MGLRNALHEWRKAEAIRCYGIGRVRLLGACLVMTDDIAQRIVDCSYLNKLRTVDDFEREIDWKHAAKYAVDILAIVKAHIPDWSTPQVPADHTGSTELSTGDAPAAMPNNPRPVRRTIRCGACEALGHRRT